MIPKRWTRKIRLEIFGAELEKQFDALESTSDENVEHLAVDAAVRILNKLGDKKVRYQNYPQRTAGREVWLRYLKEFIVAARDRDIEGAQNVRPRHRVKAGGAQWSFSVSEPTVTHTRAPRHVRAWNKIKKLWRW